MSPGYIPPTRLGVELQQASGVEQMILNSDLKRNLTRQSLPIVIAYNGENHFCPTQPLDPVRLNVFHISVLGDLLSCCKVASANINKDMLQDDKKQALGLFEEMVNVTADHFSDPKASLLQAAQAAGLAPMAPPVVPVIPSTAAEPDNPAGSPKKKKKMYKCRGILEDGSACPKQFPRSNGRKIHEYIHHKIGTGWFCDVPDCQQAKDGYCFAGDQALKKHMNSQHRGIWQFVCHEVVDDKGTECLWGTYQKAAIPLHMAKHGKGTGHFECPHCGKQFQGELTLTAHIKNDVCRKGKNFVLSLIHI